MQKGNDSGDQKPDENWYTRKRGLREWMTFGSSKEKMNFWQLVFILLTVITFLIGGRALRSCTGSHDGFLEGIFDCLFKLEFLDHLSPRHGNGYVRLPRPPSAPVATFEKENLVECENPVLGQIATIYQFAYPELDIEILCNKQDAWRVHGFPRK